MVFIDSNTYIPQGTNFKLFCKEYYAIILDSSVVTYYTNFEHGIEHDVLIVLVEFASINRHS